MATEKDFNVPPYFDDFDANNRYHRILFRPSVAVQARELTQLQTTLQDQIETFGNHVFKDGSIVDGCAITYYPNVHYISVEDRFDTNVELFPTDLTANSEYRYLVTNSEDSDKAVRALIQIAKTGSKNDPPNTNRFYFTYIATGTDSDGNDVNRFSPGDTLYFYVQEQNKFANLDPANVYDTIQTLSSNSSFNAEGFAYCVSVSDGTIFQKGFFTKVEPHTIAVRDFSTNVESYVIGFDTEETIVDENIDENLLDNALGYSNENAPGAHRLKLSPVLVSKTRTDAANNKNFFSIVEFDGQQPTQQNDDIALSTIQQTFSRRTYEESGDYVIEPFKIETLANEANSQSFFYQISPGIAYVRGNRIEKIGPSKVIAPRAIDTEFALNQVVTGNYGSYVVCDEFLGLPDLNQLDEIELYDTAQNAISQRDGISSAPSGTRIGFANVRAVQYENGTKGLPSAQYLVYLFNIRMNSGKSFSNVKSLYASGTFGNFKANVVLDGGKAVLKESTKSTLVFYNGLSATKSLTNNTGIGDTSFVYTQAKNAGTMTSTGVLTVTIDLAASGGVEKLNSSTGTVLTGNGLEPYTLYFSANAYTSNLASTVSITNGSPVVTGTLTTTFLTDFKVGSLIRIDTGGSPHIATVTAVANDSSLTISNVPSTSNSASNYQLYFIEGSALPLANVTIVSNTQFTANLGYTLDSSDQTVYASYPVNRTEAQPVPKVIRKSRFVKINCTSNTTGPWNLGFPDIHKIKKVYVGTTYSDTNPDRLDWFTLDSGQRDTHYDHGKLVLNPKYASKITSSSRLLVELDYFYANTSASVGFFSVESYPIDDANTSNTNAIQTIDIPTFNGNDLRNYIDFRPRKANTAADATAIASASENPATSNSNTFNVSVGGHFLLSPDTNFEADFEYYVPRVDLITLNSSGRFIVNKGKPAITPSAPFVESDQSAIAEAFVPAYPSPTVREVENRQNIKSITTSVRTNRRYTMKDIGSIEERVKRIEYYTVLSTLEQQAKDLTIPDASGLNRFKNGIFADPFNSHNIGNVNDFEYKIAIDPQKTEARPTFTNHDVDLRFNSSNSTGVQQTGSIVTLPYTSNAYIIQRFATNYRVACESQWKWYATVSLYPSYSINREEKTRPNINVNLDLTAPWQQFADSPFGTVYGDWRTISTSTSVQTASSRTGSGTLTTATTTTSTTQQQINNILRVNTVQETYDLGSYVTDISIQPYIPEQVIAFEAHGLKPNTRLHVFFDDVNVDQHVAPGTLSGTSVETAASTGRPDNVVSQTGNFGTAIYSNSSGSVYGKFKIPANTFRIGDRIFQVTNIDNLTTGADAKLTSGSATFTSSGIEVTKGSTTLNITQPSLSSIPVARSNTIVQSSSSSTFVADPTVTSVPFDGGGDGGGGGDPIAQSFVVTNIPSNVSGVFLTQVGVYFKQKDTTLGCSVLISEMKDGFPDNKKIIGRGYLPSASINVSDTAATETVFTLTEPVYLLSNREYAFTIFPDGNSPEYIVWVGKTGERDVITNEQVFSNPYNGVMFVSANQRTWTAIQKEDIKFKLYRAKFTGFNGTAIFNNENDEFITVDGFNKSNSSVGLAVGDVVLTVNSTVDISNTEDIVSKTLTGSGHPKGYLQYFNEAVGEVWLDSSNGGFSNTTNPTIAVYRLSDPSNNALVSNTTLIAYANVEIVNDLKYHAVVPKFGVLQPSTTAVFTSFKGTRTTDTIDPSYYNVINEIEYEFSDYERHVKSKSNEITDLASNKSVNYRLLLRSESDFVSPVVSLRRKTGMMIENIINNDHTNEHTRYGNAIAKYVSKKVTLADGQEAEDLRVLITAHRPYETDVKVYCKLFNNQDPGQFDDKVWSEMQYLNGGEFVYTSSSDVNDRVEFEFGMPSINLVSYGAFANVATSSYDSLTGTISIANNSNEVTGTGTSFNTELTVGDTIRIVSNDYFAIRTVTSIANSTSMTLDNGVVETNTAALFYVFNNTGNDGIVEYQNADGARFIGFKDFAIKIVLLSSNPVKVPILSDARAIALQI